MNILRTLVLRFRARLLLRYLSFPLAVAARFREEHFAQAAASLAYTTLLSLVPLTAMVLAIVAVFPIFSGVVEQVDNFLVANLMPGKTGTVVAKYVTNFSLKAGRLTSVGFALLAFTAFLLLANLEQTFNRVWRVSTPRPFAARLQLYVTVLLLGPLVLGSVFGAISFAVTESLGLINEPPWLRQVLFKLTSLFVLGEFLTFLYRAVPNAYVERRNALVGGVAAALAFSLMQRGFEVYLANFPSYTLIYGAFAAVPIFLLWLYLSWVVILIGALIVATLPPSPGQGIKA